jgi:MarR family transcriptional regulator, transcriptional regulator for hemolysin
MVPYTGPVYVLFVSMLDYLARVGRRAAENAPDGLRPRHVIALTLLSEQGSIGQQGLADALSLHPSNVVGLLNELEERALITRRRDPADRRRHIVELSDKGTDELASASRRLGLIEDKLFTALTTEERETLHTLLSRVVGATSAMCSVAELPSDCLA